MIPRFQIRQHAGTIGKMAVIGHAGKQYVAQVIDQIAGTTTPKRVRIIGSPGMDGTVLMPTGYTFKGWADDD